MRLMRRHKKKVNSQTPDASISDSSMLDSSSSNLPSNSKSLPSASSSSSDSSHDIRKAAILIDSLDEDSTRLFLRKLNLSTAREIHQLAKDLGQVTREEKERVLSEFLKTIQQISSSEKV